MAEILIKAMDHSHPDPNKDRAGCYKRGMCVVVKDDGHPGWGAKEGLPKFAVLKVPGVSAAKLRKYTAEQMQGNAPYRRRLWRVRWEDLPAAARRKLAETGELIVKTGEYSGDYDFTWQQVKNYFRNLETNQDETEGI